MQNIPYTKPFLSYEAQLALLKSRRLQVTDESKALHLLEKIGYYRLSGYWYPLLADKQQHIFKPNAHFDTAFDLYKFDRELRQMIISELEKIEVAVRSKIAHVLSTEYGSFWITNENLFASSAKHKTTLDKISEEYGRSNEDFIVSFKSKYSNSLPPAFILLEVTSFGTLSRLYSNLKSSKAKKDIAKAFALPDVVFDSWLHSLIGVRNVCAHHARVWNKQMKIQPLLPRKTDNIWLTDNNICNNRIYYVLSIILYFLNTVNPTHTFKQKLENLFVKYSNVDKQAMGFPANWQNEPLWQ